MSKIQKQNISLKTTVALAMLAALSIILGKYLAIPVGDVLRFSLENLPVLFAAIAFGPIAGMLVGAVADVIGCLLVGFGINPIVTLGAMAIGAVSGILSALFKRRVRLGRSWQVAIAVALAHLIGSVIIKTLGLAAFYAMPFLTLMLWRLLNYTIVGGIEILILFLLFNNKEIDRQIDKMKQ